MLYLSRYVVQHKADYYRSLQSVRETAAWESWVLYVLRAVEETSRETLIKVPPHAHARSEAAPPP